MSMKFRTDAIKALDDLESRVAKVMGKLNDIQTKAAPLGATHDLVLGLKELQDEIDGLWQERCQTQK